MTSVRSGVRGQGREVTEVRGHTDSLFLLVFKALPGVTDQHHVSYQDLVSGQHHVSYQHHMSPGRGSQRAVRIRSCI